MPKRRRTEDEDALAAGSEDVANGPTPVIRCEEVRFEDGNLVIQAGNTQFKVHRSVLAKHSPVFADLFKVPHPADEPTVEGCLVVELQDSAEDLEHVLLALYGDPNYVMTSKPLHFLKLAAMLRLGKKYEVEHLRDESLAILQREFPIKLDEYDQVSTEWTHFQFPLGGAYETNIKQVIAIINLALECGIQTILPIVYFMYIRHEFKLNQLLSDTEGPPIPYRALVDCIIARDKLVKARASSVHEAMQKIADTESCRSEECASLVRSVAEALWANPLEMWNMLYPYSNVMDGLANEVRHLCDRCYEQIKPSYEEARRRLWNALPTYFGLPQWKDLKDLEA